LCKHEKGVGTLWRVTGAEFEPETPKGKTSCTIHMAARKRLDGSKKINRKQEKTQKKFQGAKKRGLEGLSTTKLKKGGR